MTITEEMEKKAEKREAFRRKAALKFTSIMLADGQLLPVSVRDGVKMANHLLKELGNSPESV